MKGPVITVGGPHGTGKSTYASALATALGLRYVCAGELFRELAKEKKLSLEKLSELAAKDPAIDKMIDERTKGEAKDGGVVIDAQLGAWMARDLADVKVFIQAPDRVRFKRIAERDRISVASARRETLAREEIQKRRYKKYYGINVDDLSIYDLKFNAGLFPLEKMKKIVIDNVRNFLAKKSVK